MALRRGSFPARAARRRTGWEEGPGGSISTSFTSSGQAILNSGIQALLDGLTIARIRGKIQCQLETATAAGDGFHGAYALGVVTADAFNVGITAVPKPIDDIDWDGWMVHGFFDVHSVTSTLADGVNLNAVHFDKEIDGKAMRKFGLNDVLFGIVQVVENGAATLEVFFDSRLLFKLP